MKKTKDNPYPSTFEIFEKNEITFSNLRPTRTQNILLLDMQTKLRHCHDNVFTAEYDLNDYIDVSNNTQVVEFINNLKSLDYALKIDDFIRTYLVCSYIDRNPRTNIVTITLNKDFVDHYTNIKIKEGNFTKISPHLIVEHDLFDTNSNKLYKVLRGHSLNATLNSYSLTVKEFRKEMNMVNSYDRFTDLHKRVIIPAINKMKNLFIGLELVVSKKGRSIDKLLFIWDSQVVPDQLTYKDELNNKVISAHDKYLQNQDILLGKVIRWRTKKAWMVERKSENLPSKFLTEDTIKFYFKQLTILRVPNSTCAKIFKSQYIYDSLSTLLNVNKVSEFLAKGQNYNPPHKLFTTALKATCDFNNNPEILKLK